MSANVTYFRRWYGNVMVTDNLAVTPANFDPYCVTAPADARLASGGAYQVCGLYDINPSKFGQVNNLVTYASNFGGSWQHYNGVDATIDARLSHGTFVQGGLNIGRDEINQCGFALANPQMTFVQTYLSAPTGVTEPRTQAFCDMKPPFQTQVKLLGNYSLPWWDLQTSATFQSLPGPMILASQAITNAQIAPSLGRNLSAGARATVTVDLIPPGTLYGDRLYQVDFRVSKIVKAGRSRIRGNLDLYNMFNASTILVVNTRYGPSWLQPTYVLPGRVVKFSGQIDF